jgi:transposase
VITSGGFTAAFDILGPIFGQASGIEVVTEYAPPWAVDLNPSRFAWRVARRRTSSSSTDRRSMS